MASKLIPKNPQDVTVIRRVTPNITTFSAPFERFGYVKIGGRGTAVRLQSGGVAVFSPTALTDAVKEAVSSLGEVKYLSALDFEHHIFLGDWHKQYPNAKVIGVEGLEEKREKSSEFATVPFHVTFTEKEFQHDGLKVDPEFDANFDVEYVHAHQNKELVFNYKPDRTLIQADMFFNLPATEQYSAAGPNKTPVDPSSNILTRFFSSLNNLSGNMMGQRRFIWYLISSGNRPAYNQSVARIQKWDFDRVIPCHGDVIETGGKELFEKLMAWHLVAAKKTS